MTGDQAARPPAPAPAVRVWGRRVDRFLGSDPGLNRFGAAVGSVLTTALILEAVWVFVHFTNALQIQAGGARLPAVRAAQVALANHATGSWPWPPWRSSWPWARTCGAWAHGASSPGSCCS